MTQDVLAHLAASQLLHDAVTSSEIVTSAYRLFGEVAEKDLLTNVSAFHIVDSWLRACSAAAL